MSMKAFYANKSKDELSIPLDCHIPFNLKSTTTCLAPEPAATKPFEKDGVKTRYFAKVMILSGPAPVEEDKTKGKLHLSKKLNFLLVRKEHGTVAPIGGEWSAEKDGATPTEAALKKTAIRTTKDLIGVDLSKCSNWLKFVEFSYTREEGRSVTVIFVPNVWDHFKDGIEPSTQVREETKEVTETVEEEEDDPTEEEPEKKKTVKKQVTTNKTVEVVLWRPYEMSLHGMLEYDCTRPSVDDVVEFCLFADCFHEMLQRDFGLEVIDILRKKGVEIEENDRKRKRDEEEAAEKKAKTESGEEVKEEKKDETKPKTKLQHTINQEVLLPFQYFDRQPHTGIIAGSLRRDVLEGMMHQFGTLTKHEIDDLLLKGAGLKPSAAPSILYYVKIATTTTEVPVVEEPVVEASAAETAEEAAEEKPAEDSMMEDAEAEGVEAPEEGGAMTEAGLNKLLLKDLRTMCQEKNLSTAGKKADLIERLLKGE